MPGGSRGLLGVSDHPFPPAQAYARISFDFSTRVFQRLLVKAFHRLNGYIFTLEIEDAYCRIEAGIAEGGSFISIGQEEVARFEQQARFKILPYMDFLVHAAYWRVLDDGKARPLWGDLQRVRVVFVEEGSAELQICHLKGTRRIPLNDLIMLILQHLEKEVDKAKLAPIEVKEVRGH